MVILEILPDNTEEMETHPTTGKDNAHKEQQLGSVHLGAQFMEAHSFPSRKHFHLTLLCLKFSAPSEHIYSRTCIQVLIHCKTNVCVAFRFQHFRCIMFTRAFKLSVQEADTVAGGSENVHCLKSGSRGFRKESQGRFSLSKTAEGMNCRGFWGGGHQASIQRAVLRDPESGSLLF